MDATFDFMPRLHSELDSITGAKFQNLYSKSSQDKSDINVYKLCRTLIKYVFVN